MPGKIKLSPVAASLARDIAQINSVEEIASCIAAGREHPGAYEAGVNPQDWADALREAMARRLIALGYGSRKD